MFVDAGLDRPGHTTDAPSPVEEVFPGLLAAEVEIDSDYLELSPVAPRSGVSL